jgi:hypothetical protein
MSGDANAEPTWPPSWWPPAQPYQWAAGDPVLPRRPVSARDQLGLPLTYSVTYSGTRTVDDVLFDWHRYERAHGRGQRYGQL